VIGADGAELHQADPGVFNWAETTFLIFSVPEAALSGSVYLLARPNAGVCLSSIYIHQGICVHPYQVAYADAQMHLPCPDRLSGFTLPNGFGIDATRPPEDYRFRYDGPDGRCRFDLDFRGRMAPFDAHDPEHNPLLTTFGNAQEAGGFGEAWANGHFDLVGHITGRLELDGRSWEVDCWDGLDHSWGPRGEWNLPPVAWMHMTFGPELGVHLAMTLDAAGGTTAYHTLRFGYVADGSGVTGVASAEVEAENDGMLGMRRVVRITDAKGRSFEMVGEAVAAAPWYVAYPSFVSFQSLYRWTMAGTGVRGEPPLVRVGFSHITDVFSLASLAGQSAPLCS
jgi:hypothetical protein